MSFMGDFLRSTASASVEFCPASFLRSSNPFVTFESSSIDFAGCFNVAAFVGVDGNFGMAKDDWSSSISSRLIGRSTERQPHIPVPHWLTKRRVHDGSGRRQQISLRSSSNCINEYSHNIQLTLTRRFVVFLGRRILLLDLRCFVQRRLLLGTTLLRSFRNCSMMSMTMKRTEAHIPGSPSTVLQLLM